MTNKPATPPKPGGVNKAVEKFLADSEKHLRGRDEREDNKQRSGARGVYPALAQSVPDAQVSESDG